MQIQQLRTTSLQVIDADSYFGKMKEDNSVLNKGEGELKREEAAFFKNNILGVLDPTDRMHQAMIDLERDPWRMRKRNYARKTREKPPPVIKKYKPRKLSPKIKEFLKNTSPELRSALSDRCRFFREGSLVSTKITVLPV